MNGESTGIRNEQRRDTTPKRRQSFEVDGTAYRRSDTTLGNKGDEIVANSCRREIDKKKQAVDIKVTVEVSPSGRMARVGRHVIGCGFPVENSFCY